ncbi:heat repeat-containing protein [Gordonia bronchialis DSM 43247]|uniref:Heat repeat-containing protein n=1 Tax=Gordonia bronchialis (strain ATCC 25592 / DSM 43247 / BCRC 13721 / JCM 3198 / KCTC 3076 / NBRC 16047 / NCTC 10667) TaxID=526226 RepID=D0L6Y5_GORB4|nr:HEAT repeat domain-containing protein [Gordonia bronchialis]ACY20770.1 heat repeat-containing protein [Gordonia bronchialis DSM 43247]MCC3323544.1 HEAT repeat domain-containing protein [Gordonia bronchialis]QGS25483.1 HEAT repeat domain-containing protein [Gordonia bronchialis]UAK38087.1 HEAT repeat domain-containing protein [Gordonia bronchialis]STQ63603.1 Uncharacterised protein [Gordonia bronchialis]
MTQTTTTLTRALSAPDASTRLRAALAAGTAPEAGFVDPLVQRCAVEPDFFVRDMLTWALTRLPAEVAVPRLVVELSATRAQARSQALHTLSKIGDRAAWPAITDDLLHDTDTEVARAAWRAAVVLAPADEHRALASSLAREFGRGDTEVQRSLSRAFVTLGEAASSAVTTALRHPDPPVRAHAKATRRLIDDPESDFETDLALARKVVAC